MILRLVEKYAWLLWLVPALLLWAAFPPLAEKVDALFALAPLLWLVRRPGAMRRVVIIWFFNGFCFWLATLSWMPAIVKNGGPWPLVALGLVALSAYCALYFAAYGFLAKSMWDFVRGRSYWFRLFAVVVVEPVLWAGLEIVRSRFLGGFAWNQLGTVAVNAGFGAPAAFGGVYILSMVIVLINGTITGVAERIFRKGGTALETLLPLVIVYALYSFSGSGISMARSAKSRLCNAISLASSTSRRQRIRMRSIPTSSPMFRCLCRISSCSRRARWRSSAE